MIHQNFQTSLSIGHSPSLWESKIVFFQVPILLKVHEEFERHP